MNTIQHITKENGEVKDREKLLRWFNRLLDRMPDGEIVLELMPTDITDAQRRYYMSQVGQMAKHFGMRQDSLHKRLKMLFFPSDMLEIGCTSLRDLDKDKMSDYIDECIRFSAENGFKWGDPEEYKHFQ